jgi:hypothetical protein
VIRLPEYKHYVMEIRDRIPESENNSMTLQAPNVNIPGMKDARPGMVAQFPYLCADF